MASSRALVFPAEEDFGIVAAEAVAAGTPVVAFRRGGSRDTIVEGRSGVFFDEQTVSSLTAAVRRVAAREWDARDVSRCADAFSERRFISEMSLIAETALADKGLS